MPSLCHYFHPCLVDRDAIVSLPKAKLKFMAKDMAKRRDMEKLLQVECMCALFWLGSVNKGKNILSQTFQTSKESLINVLSITILKIFCID